MNRRILDEGHKGIQRFFALDTQAYQDGALPSKTKELMGLCASMVLRCDDCVTYHVIRCKEEGCSNKEIMDAFNVALVVGGSIVIPHLRRAVALLDEMDYAP
ncbi:MAG: carboxymuconolactone decarboxylase family protein [Acidobacteria bacterium]|jgi:AhpD family alkylhydroperoxidase|nr:carboxymuconolactone decarboxylase family protein [Acidobacteriota bacterium]